MNDVAVMTLQMPDAAQAQAMQRPNENRPACASLCPLHQRCDYRLAPVAAMPTMRATPAVRATPAMTMPAAVATPTAMPAATILHLRRQALGGVALHGNRSSRAGERCSAGLLRRRSDEQKAGNGSEAENLSYVHELSPWCCVSCNASVVRSFHYGRAVDVNVL
jgi:hypothetical protein